MSNNFDCNIGNASIKKTDITKFSKTDSQNNGYSQEYEYKEGSSLNLSPAAISGRAMIDVKLPQQNNIMNRAEFEKLASRKMQENLLFSDSRSFIGEILKEIKPQEQADFLKWIDFCNNYAQIASKTYTEGDESDRWCVTDNFRSFVENPVLRSNTDSCIELLEIYKKSEDDVESSPKIKELVRYHIKNSSLEQINTHLKAIDALDNFVVREKSFWGSATLKKPDISELSRADYDNILLLEPLSKIFKPDFEVVKELTWKKDTYNIEITKEDVQKVIDAVKDLKNPINEEYKSKIVKEMIFADDKEFEKLNKWLHYIDKNITNDINMFPFTQDMIDTILFKDKEELREMFGEQAVQEIHLFEKLTENQEIFDLVRDKKIDITNGISLYEAPKDNSENIDSDDNFSEQFISEISEQFISELSNDYLIESILNANSIFKNKYKRNLMEILATHNKEELLEKLDKVDKLKQKTFAEPKLYLNGNETNPRMIEATIKDFYNNNSVALLRLVSVADKETTNVLMRKRFDDFEEYLNKLNEFSTEELTLFKNLSDSLNIDGKPFLPTQKVDFIDIITEFKNNNLDMSKMHEMVKNGKIDVAQLKIDLFNQIMKNAGLSDEEIAAIPKKKLLSWDKKYAHLLAKAYTETDEYDEVDESGYNDIIRAANLFDFEEYINDTSNKYGQTNLNTKQIFKDKNLNYENWVHPSKNNEINFVVNDKNKEKLKQIASQITEDMNTLMKTPVKGHIKKQFPEFVKNDEFFIPNEYLSSKYKLQELVMHLKDETNTGKMSAVWKRAQNNVKSDNPDRAKMAQGTLTILDHLQQREKDIEKMKNITISKDLNWKIKMWDRNPQKDLFQGNYSTCCIGVGNGNGHAMPHYLMNTTYNMIEIADNENGETVGNALCYFVTTENGKPAFVIDNVEINNGKKPSDEAGLVVREKIFEYAAKVAKDVTGKDNTPIFISDQFNDIPYKDLPSHKEKVSLLGDIDCDNIYMDMFSNPAEWTPKDELTQTVSVLTLTSSI